MKQNLLNVFLLNSVQHLLVQMMDGKSINILGLILCVHLPFFMQTISLQTV